MAEQALKLMTVDEFLVWDDGTDTRYELADGSVHAMAPASNAHGVIVGNACMAIGTALRGRQPCKFVPEAGVRIDQRTWWKADIAVTCTPGTPGSDTDQPLLVVEVLSPSTRMHDLGRKLNDYKALTSVREVWMVDSERRWLQLWRLESDGWIAQDLVVGAVFNSPVLGVSVELNELYDQSGL